MPELPEVETIRRGLQSALKGKTIVKVFSGLVGLRIPFPENLAGRLANRRIESFDRRAKYLLVRLDDSQILVVHLGMSGRLRAFSENESPPREKHDHMVIAFKDGQKLVLNDPRRFGMVLLFGHEREMESHPAFCTLGPEPLDSSFDGAALELALAGRKTAIKTALLDQKIVAGIGNIYACEALFAAGIHPLSEAGNVRGEKADALAAAVKKILLDAIEAGGSSLRDYRRADGELGYFQHLFSVYGRKEEACPGCTCDAKVTGGIRRIAQGGRSTFFCSLKQKRI